MEEGPERHDRGEVLIVEDSPTQSLELKTVLEENGFTVRCARNGREALDVLRGWRPAIILSDVVMPEMGGYDFCRTLKQNHDYSDIPVILLTSLSDPIDVIRGLECGADNFIVKPFDKQYLVSQISVILLNLRLSPMGNSRMGVEVMFGGQKFYITSDRLQILNLLLSTYETAVRQNRQLVEARGELQQLNERLEEKVSERTAALEVEVKERRRAEAEVRRLNRDLEKRVQQRTAELEAANRELEAFSYSISHDLRAPLRTVTSFAEALIEDFQLPEDVNRYVDRILAKSLKMRSMIDALLTLSRLTSRPMQRQSVEVNQIVREVIQDLESDERHGRVRWEIEELIPCSADPDLIRHVFSNLISNAFKYTAKRDNARIAVSSDKNNGHIVYTVHDNGVGFDPTLSSRLFEVFYRLHNGEFEGTGIGLSIVKRIVDRHGGQVWAEGELNKGATFYVRLPTE